MQELAMLQRVPRAAVSTPYGAAAFLLQLMSAECLTLFKMSRTVLMGAICLFGKA